LTGIILEFIFGI